MKNISPDIAPFKSNQKLPKTIHISSKLETSNMAKCLDVYLYSEQDTAGSVLFPKPTQFSFLLYNTLSVCISSKIHISLLTAGVVNWFPEIQISPVSNNLWCEA